MYLVARELPVASTDADARREFELEFRDVSRSAFLLARHLGPRYRRRQGRSPGSGLARLALSVLSRRRLPAVVPSDRLSPVPWPAARLAAAASSVGPAGAGSDRVGHGLGATGRFALYSSATASGAVAPLLRRPLNRRRRPHPALQRDGSQAAAAARP